MGKLTLGVTETSFLLLWFGLIHTSRQTGSSVGLAVHLSVLLGDFWEDFCLQSTVGSSCWPQYNNTGWMQSPSARRSEWL